MLIFAVGICIGLVLGLTGAGGSALAVPLLVILAGLPVQDAVGIALLAVAVSAALGAIQSLRVGAVLRNPAIVLAISGALFAPIGNAVGSNISPELLATLFAALALVIAIRLFVQALKSADEDIVVRAGISDRYNAVEPICRMNSSGSGFEWRPRCVGSLAAGGTAVGFLAGLFGVGGGFLIVPLLLYLTNTSMHQIVGTSLVVITLTSATAFLAYLLRTSIEERDALILASVGALVGMSVSITVAGKVPGILLQKLFALTLVAFALLLLAKSATAVLGNL